MNKNIQFTSTIGLIFILAIFVGCGDKKQADNEALAETKTKSKDQQSSQSIEANTKNSEQQAITGTLPDNIVWHTNTEDKIFADPNATKGGTFNTFIPSFPLTLRTVGPDSNGSFAGYLRGLQMGLLDFHPNTMNPIPALATHWAFDEDQKTIYYKLDPDAQWSDGQQITADDYLFTLTFMRSEHIIAPWYNEYYTTQITEVIKYDEYTIAVKSANAKPRDELIAATSLSPTPEHFHVLNENWVQDFNWKNPPTTSAYVIHEVKKGKYVSFKRLENWWGKDKQFYQYRFNVNKIKVKVIRDQNIAWTHFLKGELDSFALLLPKFWHKKAVGESFDQGLIQKVQFYNNLPQPAYGLWLNASDPLLKDINLRLGLAYSMNVQKVISTVLHDDYDRLDSHHVGFGNYSNAEIKARKFDLDKADHYFNLAGWVTRGPDGVRIKNKQSLSLEIVYGSPHHTDRLVILREEALKAGVELNLKLVDSSAAFKQVLEKKHQIASMAWSGGGISPRYWEHYHSLNADKPQTNNITNTNDKVLDQKIETYRKELSLEKRVKQAHELEQMIHDSAVMIPMTKVPYTREAIWAWVKLPSFYANKRSDALTSVFGDGLFWVDSDLKSTIKNHTYDAKSFKKTTIIDKTWLQE